MTTANDLTSPLAPQAPLAVTVSPETTIQVEVAQVTVTSSQPTRDEQFQRGLLSPAESAQYRVDRGDAAQAARYSNGQIPEDLLCPLSFTAGLLRCDAAAALERAIEAGMPAVELNSTYRSYAAQVRVARRVPDLAATPGRSQHGNAIAIDVPADGGMQDWLRRHPDVGFSTPAWARPGGTLPEPWHFEFIG